MEHSRPKFYCLLMATWTSFGVNDCGIEIVSNSPLSSVCKCQRKRSTRISTKAQRRPFRRSTRNVKMVRHSFFAEPTLDSSSLTLLSPPLLKPLDSRLLIVRRFDTQEAVHECRHCISDVRGASSFSSSDSCSPTLATESSYLGFVTAEHDANNIMGMSSVHHRLASSCNKLGMGCIGVLRYVRLFLH